MLSGCYVVSLIITHVVRPLGLLLLVLLVLGALIPTLACGVRRLHDTGKSGAFILFGLIPFVGGIILLVFFVRTVPRRQPVRPEPQGHRWRSDGRLRPAAVGIPAAPSGLSPEPPPDSVTGVRPGRPGRAVSHRAPRRATAHPSPWAVDKEAEDMLVGACGGFPQESELELASSATGTEGTSTHMRLPGWSLRGSTRPASPRRYTPPFGLMTSRRGVLLRAWRSADVARLSP